MALTQINPALFAGATNTTAVIQSNGTTAITVDSSQNVGIGTSSPTAKLYVASSVSGYTSSLADSVTNAATLLKTNSSDSTVTSFGGTNTGVATIQRSNGGGTTPYDIALSPFGGNLLVGTTSAPTGATGSVVANNASYIGSKVVTWSKVAQSNVITATVTFQTTSSWWTNYIKFTISCVQSNSANNFAASYLYQIATLDASGGSPRNVLAQGDNAQFTVTVTGNSGTGSQIWTVSVTGPATANRSILTLEAGSSIAVGAVS